MFSQFPVDPASHPALWCGLWGNTKKDTPSTVGASTAAWAAFVARTAAARSLHGTADLVETGKSSGLRCTTDRDNPGGIPRKASQNQAGSGVRCSSASTDL